MHKTLGLRDPAAAFPLVRVRDDAGERRQANRAIAASAVGLGFTGLVELLLAVLTGSVGLLGDAIHNLSDVSTSAVEPRRAGLESVWGQQAAHDRLANGRVTN